MKNKLSYAILAAAVAVPALLAPTPGFAATNDEAKSGLYFTKEGEKGAYYTFEAWAALTQVEKGVLLTKYGTANVQVLLKAQGFEKITTLGAISDSGKPFLEAAVEYKDGDIEGTFVNAETNEEIVIGDTTDVVVESVKALEATVFKGSNEAQTLQFEINDGKKVSLEDLTENGYAVEFIASKNVLDNGSGMAVSKNNTGKLKLTGASTDFTFVVKVSKEDKTLYSEDTEVKVVNATDVKEVKKFVVYDGAKKLDTITKADGDLTLKISEYVQADGKLIQLDDAAAFKVVDSTYTVKSSNRGVLNPLLDSKLKIMGAGETTITVSKGDLVLGSTKLKVEADARIATTATAEDVKLSKANSPKTVDITVKDQYGNVLPTTTYLHATKGENAVVTTAGNTVSAIDDKKGVDTVYISTSADAENTEARLGSFKVTVEKAGIIVSHDVEVKGSTTIDANSEAAAEKKSFTAKIAAKDSKGVIDSYLALDSAVSADESVAKAVVTGDTVTINAVATGTTKITLEAGDITKTVNVTVIDTTAPVVTVVNGSSNLLVGVVAANEIEFTYADENSTVFGNSGEKIELNFSQNVQLKTATVAGVDVSEEVLYEAVSYTGKNFMTEYVDSITIAASKFNPTIKGAIGLVGGSELVVTMVNEAGVEATYTVKYTKN